MITIITRLGVDPVVPEVGSWDHTSARLYAVEHKITADRFVVSIVLLRLVFSPFSQKLYMQSFGRGILYNFIIRKRNTVKKHRNFSNTSSEQRWKTKQNRKRPPLFTMAGI